MSYVVLARKYRPRSFEEMVGQDHVVRALTHALEQQRLHHAYLFTGTRGIGKTTVSRILAKSLNCTGPDGQGGITARPCGVCSACREIDADRYIDYVELDAASNRSIDEIRELIERAAYKPSVGRFKVFMIDEAHQLTKDAFNALLKTLEEPPDYLKFVLATTDPEKMLPTVLSRCLQFNLRPMAPQTVAEHLARVLEAEQVQADAGALRQLSRAARGSMRDALSLTDQAIAFGGGQLEESAVRAMLGAVDRRHAERLVQSLSERDGRAVIDECEALRAQGLSAAGTLDEMARLLQQMAVAQAVANGLDETDPDTEAARRLHSALAPDETQLLYSICLQGRAELSLAPDEYAGLVMTLLRFMAFPAMSSDAAPPAGSGGRTAAAPLLAKRAEHRSVAVPTSAAPAARPQAAAPVTQTAARPVASTPPASVPVAAPRAALPVAPPEVPMAAPSAAAPNTAPANLPEAPPAMSRPVAAPPVMAAPAPAPVVAARQQPSAPARASAPDDGPPPWMDEAPFEADVVPVAASAASQRIERPVEREAEPEHFAPAAPVERRAAAADRLAAIEVMRTPLGDRWAALTTQLTGSGAIAALARELAMQAELIGIEAQGGAEVWQLRVERETLRSTGLVDKLQAAVRGVLGAAVSLAVSPGVAQDSPVRRDAEFAARRQFDAEQTIQQDPLVRAMLSQFNTARIVSGSIKPV
ncbi:MAG: DNA polymerase III subunit gamma/tau [Burkholderiales bacterium PBB6]|nr:MAG: DNA polymerase III subunit gamma/tau [Burkholderiales bacterium PBB6]